MISPTIMGPVGVNIGRPSTYNLEPKRSLQRQLVYFYYFLEVRRDGILTPFSLDASYYTDYNNFINGNGFPSDNDILAFNEGGVPGEVAGTVTRSNSQMIVEWSFTNRESLPTDVLTGSGYVQGRVEMWSRTLDRDGNIPASRHSLWLSPTTPEPGAFVGNLTFNRGNPGDRTQPGILQSNGFYKADFDIALPNLPAYGEPFNTLYVKSLVNPYSVPLSATFTTP